MIDNIKTPIYLIRHGEVDNPNNIIYGRSSIHLSALGIGQVEALGKVLISLGIFPDMIYSSPQQRTKETTGILAKTFPKAEIIFDDRLQEVEMGDLTNQSIDLVKQSDFYTDPKFSNMHIEEMKSVLQRMKECLLERVAQNPGKILFFVSHGDSLALLAWDLLTPDIKMPKINTIEAEQVKYPQKAEAWKIILDSKMHGSDLEKISYKSKLDLKLL